jgi:hypothetical protein
MNDEDPHAEEMLQKGQYISENIINNVNLYTDEEIQDILLMQESMEFHIKQDNMDKAIAECRNLYNYIQEITN